MRGNMDSSMGAQQLTNSHSLSYPTLALGAATEMMLASLLCCLQDLAFLQKKKEVRPWHWGHEHQRQCTASQLGHCAAPDISILALEHLTLLHHAPTHMALLVHVTGGEGAEGAA